MMKTYSAHMHSPVGWLDISCDNENITSVKFADSEPALQNNDHPLLIKCTEQLKKYFSGELTQFDLPLLQPGTEFQKVIWNLLISIPFGKTISYKQLTTQFGDLKAIRAVASANGKNDIAIIVPCHRVIGSNGSLTGYAGGLWRKKWLLEHEAKFRQGGLF